MAASRGRTLSTTIRDDLITSATRLPTPQHLANLRDRGDQFLVFFTEETEDWATQLAEIDPERYVLAKRCRMQRFPDGTLDGEVFDVSHARDRRVLYLASFSSYERLYEDYAALVVLTQSFPESVTIALPFFPSGTMERTTSGQIATANIDAWMVSSLPCPGRMNRIVIFDIHALQSKFYFNNTAMADLVTAVPAIKKAIDGFDSTWSVAFPDDGAAKRFGSYFSDKGHPLIVCAKVRHGDKRIVTINEGDPKDRDILIVDDLVQSGGTLIECMKKLVSAGAKSVSAWVTHAVFPRESYKRFLPGGPGEGFKMFYTTDTRPTMAAILQQYPDRFTVVPIAALLHLAL